MVQVTAAAFPAERTAVVSGCGAPRGIGRTVARRLAEAGWNVAACDVSPQVAQFVDELRTEFAGTKFLALTFDIANESAVHDAFATISEQMPPVVGVANVAGIACPTPLLEISVEEFDKVMTVSCRGTMLMMREAAKHMRTIGVGRIVNFSSITAFDGGGTFSKVAYAAAKAGIIGLTRGGARELGPLGITVNVICPGPVDTDIMGGVLTDERKDAMSADIPVGRVAAPRDIAAAVAFLLSEEAAFVNGLTMNVDGGKHMR